MRRSHIPVRVLRLRIKDKHVAALSAMARDVNFVWNYVNDLSFKIWDREHRFAGAHELQRYLNGASREGLGIGSAIFQQVAEAYATRRVQHRKVRLAWRKSRGVRRSLGWIPFKTRSVTYHGGQVRFQGLCLGLWDSYGLSQYALRAGCFSEDARGRWYLNVTVAVPKAQPSPARGACGIDLGLKQFAGIATERGTDDRTIDGARFYRDLEAPLAIAQRARKRDRVRAIHAKIGHRRKEFLHQLSTRLVREYGAIFVGNVNAQALTRTRMAKSVLDAGWSAFRTMLLYKCADAGVWFEEIDEAYSTQTCSACDSRTGPKGLEGLGMREWHCPCCGTTHDRDLNAARNILAAGHRRLAEGILPLPVCSASVSA